MIMRKGKCNKENYSSTNRMSAKNLAMLQEALGEMAEQVYQMIPEKIPTESEIAYVTDFLNQNEKNTKHILIIGNHEASYQMYCARHAD
jgi:hypothetical protein